MSPQVNAVIITEELALRAASAPDYFREKLAIQDLANQMAEHPSQVLPHLVRLAMELCGAESAGISILEAETREFRWFALQGALAVFEGAKTPRDNSPCGVTLDRNEVVLMKNPERVYDWIREAGIVVPEVLLVPLFVRNSDGVSPLGTLWLVSREHELFNAGHARFATELATFAGVALRMIQAEDRLQKALVQQEELTHEMGHRVKNLFAITDSMMRMTARTSESKDDLVEKFSGRLHALSAANSLVRRSFNDHDLKGVTLESTLNTVLAPYPHTDFDGPNVSLGDHATNSVALIFHELATNATKYGALSTEAGRVEVSWTTTDGNLVLVWEEKHGPHVVLPSKKGFGSSLIESTAFRHGGAIAFDWQSTGLIVSITLPLASLER